MFLFVLYLTCNNILDVALESGQEIFNWQQGKSSCLKFTVHWASGFQVSFPALLSRGISLISYNTLTPVN